MRTFWLVLACGSGLLVCAGPAAAQAMVEVGAAGSAAATAASAAKGVGAGISGVFGSLGKTLDAAAPKADTTTVIMRGPAAAPPKVGKDGKPAVAPPTYEDALGIQKGMSCEEVSRRFGPPAMAFAAENDASTLSYTGKSGAVQVECQAGKVASVEKPR